VRLLDWLLGRGRNPLEVPDDRPAVAATPHVRVPEAAASDVTSESRFPDETDVVLRQQAQSLGVKVEALVEMLEQRERFVAAVEADPRAWGFDLAPPNAERRDAVGEYRRATRLTGTLGESFLSGYEPLMAAAPDPLTMPSGVELPTHLHERAGLPREAAQDIAQHVRSTIQATLGRPLGADAVEHAVREASWDHDFDVSRVLPQVLDAMGDVL
jgi:hypothetical protein